MKLTNFPTVVGRRLRIAVIGCGRISKNHFSSILNYPDDLVLTSVCDTDSKALKSATAEYGVTGYADLSEMLSCENLDLLVLCTPSGLHPQQAILPQSAAFTISEKPMATSFQDGLKMVQACDGAGVRLFVVKQNRRNATLQLLKRAIDDKRFN